MASAAPQSAPPPAMSGRLPLAERLAGAPPLLRNFALPAGRDGRARGGLDRQARSISTFAPIAALLYKGVRVWQGRGPELSARVATWLVLAYFLFFPLDLWVFSRGLAADAPNPPLYAALLSAIHLLLFATLVRLYSARTNRDYAFLAVLAVTSMLASAILTVETGFLVALAVFLVLSVSTFVALEIRRSAAGAVSQPFEPGSPVARQMERALGATSVLGGVQRAGGRHRAVFRDSALHHRLSERVQSSARPDDRLYGQRRARCNRPDPAKLGRGDAHSRRRRSEPRRKTCTGAASC